MKKFSIALILSLWTMILAVALITSGLQAGDEQSGNIIVIKDPHGVYRLVAVTNADFLMLHPGTRLDAKTKGDLGGGVKALYLSQFVMNVQVRPGNGCRFLGWNQVDGILCNGEPVVSYWETSFSNPSAK